MRIDRAYFLSRRGHMPVFGLMAASLALLSPLWGCGPHDELEGSAPEPTATSTAAVSSQPWTQVAAAFPGGGLPSNLALLTDGTVLASGPGASNAWYRLTPSTSSNNTTGSYAKGTWSVLPTSNLGRLFDGSFVLRDGRYVICGGEFVSDNYELAFHPNGNSFARCELFDPTTLSWTAAPDMPEVFRDSPAVELPNGQILDLSYSSTNSFLFTSFGVSPSWSSAAPYDRNSLVEGEGGNEGACVPMQDGSAFCGYAHFSRYLPTSNVWSPVQNNPPVSLLSSPPDFAPEIGPLLLLQTGKVMVLGANSYANDPSQPTRSSDSAIYDPATGNWTLAASMPTNSPPFNHGDTPASVMHDGRVLVTSTTDQTGAAGGNCVSVLHEYDPSVDTWTAVPNPPNDTFGCGFNMRMLNLPNGQVLVAGAADGAVWLYTPNGTAGSSWVPSITSVTGPTAGVYTLTGTQLNGLTIGSNYGDDNETATNYPIVSLTDTFHTHKYYARSYNFAQMAPSPGLSSSFKFTLPSGIPSGSYSVQVSASGSVSNSVSLRVSGIHVSALNVTSPTTGTVVLSSAAPSGGTLVTLQSSDPTTLSVVSSIRIPAGSTTANFSLGYNALGTVLISANTSPANPQFVPVTARMGWTLGSLTGLSTVYDNGTGGRQVTLGWTVTLSAPAPANAVISFSSSNTAVASVQSNLTVPAGSQSLSFPLVKTSTAGLSTITASIRNSSQSYTVNNRDMDFVQCVDEGGQCDTLTGNGFLAFGADGIYNYITSPNRFVSCDTATFGDPPTGPVLRSCFLARYRSAAVPVGSTVTLSLPRNVAFGTGDQFTYQQMPAGTFTCDYPTFGGDPAPGQGSSCYLGPDPNAYTFFGDENSPFDGFPPMAMAYGASGRFTFSFVTGTSSCNNSTFGDPAVNAVKACYRVTGSTCEFLNPNQANVVVNGGFDVGLQDWNSFDPTNIVLQHQAADATGCSLSGSVQAINQNPNGENSGFYQCVPATAGVSYNAGVYVNVPSGQPQGQTFMQVAWFSGPNCTGNLTLAALLPSSAFDQWQLLAQDNLVAPAGTQSAYVYGQIIKNLPNAQPYVSDFDYFYLTPSPGHF